MWGDWEHMKQSYEDKVQDPWDWVTHFENAIARYTGAKHAIACDSNSNAIKLILHYLSETNAQIKDGINIKIPSQTYCSVPNSIILSGNRPVFINREWKKHYKLSPTPIYDCAVSLYENMYKIINEGEYVDGHNAIAILSFHHRKIINIGTGGMILTDDDSLNEWARPMIYDGRRKYFKYNTDVLQCVGWHMYMTPEQAKKGLEIFHSDRVNSLNESLTRSYEDYTPLHNQPIYKSYEFEKEKLNFNFNGDVVLNKIQLEEEEYTVYDYLFNLLTMPELIKKFNKDKWKSTFDNLDFKSLPTSINFVIYDDVECFSFWDNHPIIDWLIQYFESKGLSDRLLFYGNNLTRIPKRKDINFTPMPFFLGDTCHLSRVIDPKNKVIKKTFLHPASHPKMHRINTQIFLIKENLLEKCYWSWNPNKYDLPAQIIKKYPDLKNCKGLSDLPSEQILSVSQMHTIPEEFYESFFCLISESNYYNNRQVISHPSNMKTAEDDSSVFITEKTEKCFTAGIPFIMISTAGFLKKLKELGFKTFDKWWDESYDEEENDFRRFEKIKKLVLEISEWSLEKQHQVYAEMKDILRWNQVLNIAINVENKKIKRSRREYIHNLKFKPLPYQNSYKLESPLLKKDNSIEYSKTII